MRITETAMTYVQQVMQRPPASHRNPASDVSREERLQLLSERMKSQKTGISPNTYSERAQLLSASGPSQHSWVA
jgi:hypothetical protein